PRKVEADGEEKEDVSGSLEPPRIEDLLREGQDLVIQVTKDPLAGKGPRVTANIALPGRLLVCLPGARGVGVSRRVTDHPPRDRRRRGAGPARDDPRGLPSGLGRDRPPRRAGVRGRGLSRRPRVSRGARRTDPPQGRERQRAAPDPPGARPAASLDPRPGDL